ncbi:MAG: DUF3572 domain-containing protein [Pseudomonadota bacterium]
MFQAKKTRLTHENAIELALQALAFIAEDEDRLNAFLMQTGILPDNIRAEAQKPEFLEAVMDFMTTGDEMILGFSAHAEIAPEDILSAAHELRRHKNFD